MAARTFLIAGISGFVIDLVPLLALIFFSPGLGSEGIRGALVFGIGVVTLALLVVSTRGRRWIWLLALMQFILLTGVLIEGFLGSPFYVGT